MKGKSTHTDECYDTVEEAVTSEPVYICGKTKHVHTIACYSNPEASLETQAQWECNLPALTGNTAIDIAAIAESQIRYTESQLNYTLAGDGVTMKGYTRYGAWYGDKYADWNALFVDFCLHYAGVANTSFPYGLECEEWITLLTERGLYLSSAEHAHEKGDIIFYTDENNNNTVMSAIVTDTDENTVTVIVGDSNNAVEKKTFTEGDSAVLGCAIMPPTVNSTVLNISVSEADTDIGEPEMFAFAASPYIVINPTDIEGFAGIDLANSITTIKLYADGEEIPVNTGETPISVNVEQAFNFLISFYIGNAVKTDDYYKYIYQIPSSIMNIINIQPHTNISFYGTVGDSHVYMGQYSVDANGLLTFVLDETFATSYVDIRIENLRVCFSWKNGTGTNPTEIIFNNEYSFFLNLIHDSELLAQKTVVRNSADSLQADYTVAIKAFSDVTAVSAVDDLSGTYTYTDSNGNSHTIDVLEFHAGDMVRFRVKTADGTYRTLTGRTDLVAGDSTTAVYTISSADAAAGRLSSLPSFDLLAGDTLEFTYPAYIKNTTAALADLFAHAVTGTNEVAATINGNEDMYPVSASFSYAGRNSSLLTKTAEMSPDNTSVRWVVSINEPCIYNVNGLVVSDNLGNYLSYNTSSPFTVTTYTKNGTVVSTQDVAWADIISADGRSWEYTISDTVPYKYSFAYATTVDGDYDGALPLMNGANGRYLDCWYYSPSGDGPGGTYVEVGKRDYLYSKTGASPEPEEQYLDWTLTFTVKSGSVSPHNFLLLDTLPTFTNNSGSSDVLQLVDANGNIVDLTNGNIYDTNGIFDIKAYKLINGNLQHDSNGNITNTQLVLPGFNDGVTPIKVGAGDPKAALLNGKPAAFRITKTGLKPEAPETSQTLAAAGFNMPGTFGDYADGYAIVINYRTTSDIDNAPEATIYTNNVSYYFGNVGNREKGEVKAVVILPITEISESVAVLKQGIWNGDSDAICYIVRINEGFETDITSDTMTWVDTYDPNVEPTGNILMHFGPTNSTLFPSTASSSCVVMKGSPLVSINKIAYIPLSGFVETSAGSGVFEYVFRRKTHVGSYEQGSMQWVTVSITWDTQAHTFTYNFDDIPTDNNTGKQQNWKLTYEMKISDASKDYYGDHVVQNTFELYGDDLTNVIGTATSATAISRKQVDKSCVVSNPLEFTVNIDYDDEIAALSELSINDIMNEYLDFDFSSLALQYELDDGTVSSVLNLGMIVNKNYSSGTGTFHVQVDAGTGNTTFGEAFNGAAVKRLILTYNCWIVGALIGDQIDISNTITVDGLDFGSDEFHETIEVPYMECIGSATPLLFSILKIDGNSYVGGGEVPLESAVFSLYDITDADLPLLLTTRSTDTNGQASFVSTEIFLEGNNMSLSSLVPYRLVETTVPPGYVRTMLKKDFFLYSNSDLTNGELVLTDEQEALLEGCTPYYISSDVPVSFTFTNVQTASFTIRKTSVDNNLLITGGVAQFTLYSDIQCLTEVAVVRTNEGEATFSQLQPGTYYLKETQAPTGFVRNTGIYTVVVSQPDIIGNVSVNVTGTDASGNAVNISITSGGVFDYPNIIACLLPAT